ncbi:MAG TPA: trypsin-like peptidase domain-containing protein [Pirellulales bacterium]|nr:trypsin-like peptidase domain-containing protein [Pirellulales bacterium]
MAEVLEVEPADSSAADDSLSFLGSNRARSSFVPADKPLASKGSGSKTPWLIGGGCAALLILCGIAGFFVLNHQNAEEAAEKAKIVAANQPRRLLLDLSPEERTEALLTLDGVRTQIPDTGAFELKPGRHKVELQRSGYFAIETAVQVKPSEDTTFKPKWESLEPTLKPKAGVPDKTADQPAPASLDDWQQDVDAAIKRAADDQKDVLVAFLDSSDTESVALEYETLIRPEFQKNMFKQFELVVVELGSHPKHKVQDRKRNKETAERFGIEQVPMIVLLDSKGQPFGELGYEPGGLDQFLYALPRYVDARSERDKLFAAVDSAADQDKLPAAQKALAWLQKWHLAASYLEQLQKWKGIADQADPENKKGLEEPFFEELLIAKIRSAVTSPLEEAKKKLKFALDDLNDWKKKSTFRDQNKAVELHLALAMMLERFEMADEANAMLNDSLKFKPTNPKLADAIRHLAGNAGIRGTGSGFVVAEGGYIMTNHHVIKGAGKIKVRIPGLDQPVPARLIADDAKRDMAIIQIDAPANTKLRPLPVAAEQLGRGASVGAFGFPFGDTFGKGLKFTNGVVSGLPDAQEEGMYLLDCRVNPGNSGGALCDNRGCVVGMVTAKTSRGDEDSYGMAIPGATLIDFLSKKISNFSPAKNAGNPPLTWDKVDGAVSPSVFMILNCSK